jgi:biopolymer transport protein ExbB
LHDSLGGTRFDGKAVDSTGLVRDGKFVLVGPAAIFRSVDGLHVGTAELRLGSLEPTVFAFEDPADRLAADQLIRDGAGSFPFDPTLGNAHKIAATQESLWEHVQKGGVVMVPIFALAALALMVALFKWIGLAFLRKPSSKAVAALLDDIGRHDEQAATRKAASMRGPVGSMLAAGVAHLREPRELVEEIMYETVLTWRLRLQRFLPFIAVCAASAPLLGLLGTVTGIINTFKLITVFGAGDVKTLSGGISQALITTEYGLIVAIPSLLMHAFLSRKARGMIDEMERAAVALLNQIGKMPYNGTDEPTREREPVRATIPIDGGVSQAHAENPRNVPPRKAVGAGSSGQPDS